MDISIQSLRYFNVLAEELHFTRAAERLRISPPSLSQQISRLEVQLQERLFVRTARSVEITSRGRDLLPLARHVIDSHDTVLRWAAQVQHEKELPALRLGVVAAGAGALTTATVTSVLALVPTARIEMSRLGFFDVVPALDDGRVDIAFAPWPLALPPRVHVDRVWTEERVLVVPRHHRFAARTSLSILETSAEVFVAASGGRPDIVDWWLADPRPDGRRARRGPTADSIEGLLDLVASGAGVNIAGKSAEHHYSRDDLAFVPIRDIDPATVVLCSLAESRNPMVRIFRDTALSLSPVGHEHSGGTLGVA
jgi:DNA-binding transcriptional LysR family regulator